MEAAAERPLAKAEVASRADFSGIRYAQCWEDADVLLDALRVQPGDRCISVASGGENSLSLLVADPASVVAVDLAPAQIALVELKRAAIRTFDHADALAFVGLATCADRLRLYASLRRGLPPSAARYWDAHRRDIGAGVCTRGRFERYLALFRRVVLPLVHSKTEIDALFAPRRPADRRRFFDGVWNNRRWRALCRFFFSRTTMGRLGRDPSFFRYVEGDVAATIAARIERGLIDGDPATNPYLRWIVHGDYGAVLPHAWRPANFEAIRSRLDRVELRAQSIETTLAAAPDACIDRFNLSDIFEYVSEAASERMFDDVVRCGRAGGRVAYWNMMVPRRAPPRLASRLRPRDAESARLTCRATTFFYGAFRVDEIAGATP